MITHNNRQMMMLERRHRLIMLNGDVSETKQNDNVGVTPYGDTSYAATITILETDVRLTPSE